MYSDDESNDESGYGHNYGQIPIAEYDDAKLIGENIVKDQNLEGILQNKNKFLDENIIKDIREKLTNLPKKEQEEALKKIVEKIGKEVKKGVRERRSAPERGVEKQRNDVVVKKRQCVKETIKSFNTKIRIFS